MQTLVLEGRPLLGWLAMSVAARALSAVLGLGWSWLFASLWGDVTRPLTAAIQLGTMVLLGVVQGLIAGLFTGQVLGQILPEADLSLYVRNIALVTAIERTLVALPIALAWLDPGAGYAFAGDHTLAMVVFVLLIGPAEWWSFRQYAQSRRYIGVRAFAALLALGLQAALQVPLSGVGFDSPFGIVGRLLGTCLIGGLTALPTGLALIRIARANAPT